MCSRWLSRVETHKPPLHRENSVARGRIVTCMSSRLLRLVVLYGGVSAEHDVSRVTAAHVLAAADQAKYDLVPIGIAKDGTWLRNDKASAAIADGTPLPDALEVAGTVVDPLTELRGHADEAITVVLPLLHGPHGEDGTIQGMLELFKLPYVGAGVLSSAVCMDKAMAKIVAAQAGIPQCRWIEFRDGVDDPDTIVSRVVEELGLPVFVKPANLGSSVGITKAHDERELDSAINLALRYDNVVIIEENVTGREIEVVRTGARTAAVGGRPHFSVRGVVKRPALSVSMPGTAPVPARLP